MKFYLAKNHHVASASGHIENVQTETWKAELKYFYQLVITDIIPVTSDAVEESKCSKIKRLLINYCKSAAGATLVPNCDSTMWQLDLLVGVSQQMNDAQTHYRGYVGLDGIFLGNCLLGLRDLSDHEATIQVEYIVLRPLQGQRIEPVCKLMTAAVVNVLLSKTTPGYSPGILEIPISKEQILFRDYTIEFPVEHFQTWKQDFLNGFFTITVKFPDEALKGNYKSKIKTTSENKPIVPLNRKILEEEILADVVILTDNKTEIKAHKVFLGAQSSVFLSMFQTDMTEARESKVGIPEMSDDSIRLMLKYLYYDDQITSGLQCETAFELLCGAHKYHIDGLEKLMRQTILTKPAEWFDTDITVRLFLFAHNMVPVDSEIKEKTIQILKTCPDQLQNCPEYELLFNKHPAEAMELYFLQSSTYNITYVWISMKDYINMLASPFKP